MYGVNKITTMKELIMAACVKVKKKNKKSRIAAILLATVWISYTDVAYGISSEYLNSIKTEQVFVQSQQTVVAQRLVLLNKISESIVKTGESSKYTQDQQQLIASAILVTLLSSPAAQTSFVGDNLNTNATTLTNAIRTTLQSVQATMTAGVALNNVSSVIQTVQNAMSDSLAKDLKDSSGKAINIKSDSTLDLTPKTATTVVSNTPVAAPSPAAITRLIYTGQDLSTEKYNSLQTLEITVAQLSLQQVVNAPRALNVVVIGDALSQEINFDKLNFHIKVLDLSNVTRLTKVNALRSGSSLNIDSISLPTTVTDLKINQSSKIIASGTDTNTLPKLKKVALTRFTSTDFFTPPSWMNENDFFSDDAVLNLANYNYDNPISFSFDGLKGLASKIKTVLVPAVVLGVPYNQYITGIGFVGNVTSLPSWLNIDAVKRGLTSLSRLDLSNVTSTSINLNSMYSSMTTLLLSSSITSVSNMPNTVTHLNSYYSPYLQSVNLNDTSITHITLSDIGDVTVKNNFLCNLTKLQSFSAPFATLHIDAGTDASVGLKFLCNSSSLTDINILNIDFAGTRGKATISEEYKTFNYDGKLASVVPKTNADDQIILDALDEITDGHGKTFSQIVAPLLLLKKIYAAYSRTMGPALAFKPFLALLSKVSPVFAAAGTQLLTHANTIMTAIQGGSTVVSMLTFGAVVLIYGDNSSFPSLRGRARSYIRVNSSTPGQAISCFNNLSALKNITLNSIKLLGGVGGSVLEDLAIDVGNGGIGGNVDFMLSCPSIQSINIKNPANILGGSGGLGRHYQELTLGNVITYDLLLELPIPTLILAIKGLLALSDLLGIDLPTPGKFIETFSLFNWAFPIVGDTFYSDPGTKSILDNAGHTNLKTLTLSTAESDEIFNMLFNAGSISTLILTGNTTSKNSQKSLPKYLDGNNTATRGSSTLDITNVTDLPTTLNLRTLNPKFATIKLPTGVKYLSRSNQTVQGGTVFSTSDYSIFLDSQDGEGLVDLRFLDGAVSSGYTLYAPLSLSCYIGPVDFTMPPKNDTTTNSEYVHKHSNGSQYTRTIKRKTIVNNTLDLSDVGLTSSRTMRIDSLTGVKKVQLPEQIETVYLPSSAEDLTGHIRLKNLNGTFKLKKLKLTGNIGFGEPSVTITLNGNIPLSMAGGTWPPAYLEDARLTAENATLDLSEVPNLPDELDLTMLNSNIFKVILNPEILQGFRSDNDNYIAYLDDKGNYVPYNQLKTTQENRNKFNYATSNRITKTRVVRDKNDNGSGTPLSTGPLLSTTVLKAYTNLYFIEGITSVKRLELIGSGALGFLPKVITRPEQIIGTLAGFLPTWIFDKTKTSNNGFTLDLSNVIDLSVLDFNSFEASNITDVILPENTASIKISKQTLKTLTASSNIQFIAPFGTSSLRHLRLLGDNTTLPTWLYKNPPHTDYLNEVFASGTADEDKRTKLDISNMSKLSESLDLQNLINVFNVVTLPFHVSTITLTPRIIEVSALSDYVEKLTASVAVINTLAQYELKPAAGSTPATENNTLNGRTHLSKITITDGDTTTAIGDNFLRNVKKVEQIDFSSIAGNITSIGANFLKDSSGIQICLSVNKTPSAALCAALNTLSGQTIKLTGTTPILPAWLTQQSNVPSLSTLDVTDLRGLDPIVNLKGLASDITKVKLSDPGYYYDLNSTLSNEEALSYILDNAETIISQAPAHLQTTTRANISKPSSLETKITAGVVSGSTRRINLVPAVQTLQSARYINTSGQAVTGGTLASIPTQTVSNGVLDLSAASTLDTHLDLTTKDATTVKLPSNTVAVILHENVTTVEFGNSLTYLSWHTTSSNVKNIRLISGTATAIPVTRNPAGINLNLTDMTNLEKVINIQTLRGNISADVRKVSLPSTTTDIKLTGAVANLSDALSFIDDSAYEHLMLDISGVTGLQETTFLQGLPKVAKAISLPSYVNTITLPVNFKEITVLSTLAGITLAQNHPKLSKIKLTGSNTTLPTWTKDNTVTQTGFVLDVSQITYPTNSLLDISETSTGTLALPVNVSRIKASRSLQTIQLAASHPGLTNLAITGALTVPEWAKDASLTATTATLDLSAMTGTTVDLTGISADIISVILPTTVTNLTIPATITTISGTSILTTLKLTGNVTSIPAWAMNGTLTAVNTTLDLSAMTGLSSIINLVGINNDVTTVILPSDVTDITAPDTVTTVQHSNSQKTLTNIAIISESTTIPAWATNGSLTQTGATLDLRLMQNLPFTYTVPNLDVSILHLILPAHIESYVLGTANSGITVTTPELPTIILDQEYTSNTTIPSHLSSISVYSNLDLSNMSSLTLPLDLTGISNKIISVTLPTQVTRVQINASMNSLKLATGHPKLTDIILTGSSLVIPEWATDGSLTAANATLDVSAMTNIPYILTLALNSKIKTIKLPAIVTNLTIPTTVTTINGITVLTKLKLTGTVESIPDWALNGSLTAIGATLDLSAMTGTAVDLSGLSADITTVTLPTTVTNLTIPATGTTVTGITDKLTTLKLTGTASTVPTWATDGSLTKANATLDLSAMTGSTATIDLRGINTDITSVILPATVTNLNIPATVTTVTGPTGLTNIAIQGILATAPEWLKSTSLTAANATLDLSEILGTTVNLTGLSTDIRQLVISAENTPTGISDQLTSLKLTGAVTIPTWAKNGTLTRENATLDISAMTGRSFDLTGLNIEVTKLVINPYIKVSGITNKITTMKIVGDSPTELLADSEVTTANATLDLSEITGLLSQLSVLSAATYKTLILPKTMTSKPTTFNISSVTNLTGSFELINSLAQWDSTASKNKLDDTSITNLTIIGSGTRDVDGDLFKGCTKLESFTMNTGLNLRGRDGANYSGDTNGSSITLLTSCSALTTVDLSSSALQGGNGGNVVNGAPGGGGNITTLFALSPALTTVNLSSAIIQGGQGGVGSGGLTRGASGSVTLNATTTTTLNTTNANSKFNRINLTGTFTTLPTWINDSTTAAASATLDLSAVTGLTALNFTTITNTQIKTIILPTGVTSSNTTGWTKTGNTWTRT